MPDEVTRLKPGANENRALGAPISKLARYPFNFRSNISPTSAGFALPLLTFIT